MSLFRRIAEKLLEKIVFRRTLPASHGGARFYVSPGCGLSYLRPSLTSVDPGLLRQVREVVTLGAVVWDIGANVGLFSFAAAGLAGQEGAVFAFEPDTFLVGLLRKSSKLLGNVASPVQVIPCAVDECLSVGMFRIAERSRAANSLVGLGSPAFEGIRETQSVLTVTVDWLATQIQRPNVLKIDAEGAELRILRGATHLLSTQKPTLICEVYEENADDVTRLLHSFGYTLYDGDAPDGAPKEPLRRATYSTLAI